MIGVKRVYEPSHPADGTRFLVERFWPRGMKKESLALDGWLKDVAPSDDLRRWFDHDPAKWAEFRRRYFDELDHNPDVIRPILDAATRGSVTLLYSTRDMEHNNAVALMEYLSHALEPAS